MFIKRLAFILPMLLGSFFTNGQNTHRDKSGDTLYVTQTVIVYDTVRVFDTIHVVPESGLRFIPIQHIDNEVLKKIITPAKARLLINSGSRTATLPIDGIILSTNTKSYTSMKNLSFLGIVVLAFQNLVIAQTNVGVSVGTGSWWTTADKSVGHTENAPLFSTGLVCDLPLTNQLILSTGLHYAYLMKNYSYKGSVDSMGIQTIGEGESASAYQQFSIPLQLGYKLGNFKPNIGFQYAYRFSDRWLDRQMNLFNLQTGLSYAISENFSLGLEYSRGLNKELELKGDIFDPFSQEVKGKYDVSWKSSMIELQLRYCLHRPRPKE